MTVTSDELRVSNGRHDNLKRRTKHFALDVIHLCGRIPRSPDITPLMQQLVRSASSVGANYRAACRARSRADFIAKLSIVEEEADESGYWLELLQELMAPRFAQDILRLRDEADQLVAITVASKKTARNG